MPKGRSSSRAPSVDRAGTGYRSAYVSGNFFLEIAGVKAAFSKSVATEELNASGGDGLFTAWVEVDGDKTTELTAETAFPVQVYLKGALGR